MSRGWLLLSVALVLLGGDALLKWYVHYYIPAFELSMYSYPYGGIALFRDWQGIEGSIVHVMNRGAAWGLFSSFQEYLLYLRVAIIGGLVTYLCFVKTTTYRQWSLLFVTVGAMGNVIDYFLYGHVVDMFYFVFWGYAYPVFNVADSVIFVGVTLLLLQKIFEKRALKKSSASS